MSLVVSQPSIVNGLFGAALAAGATELKPAKKSLWGYGGVVQAPDGTIWQLASSSKKDTGPDSRQIERSCPAWRLGHGRDQAFYVDRGLKVAKSFGSKYVEFDNTSSPIKLSLYGRRGLAKVAGVAPKGSGSHRLTVCGGAGTFTDPDGFMWAPEAA